MDIWVRMHVPGGQFRLLSCDFGGEYAVQGRGDNSMVAALKIYCAEHPGFIVRPLPPHSQDRNKAENAIHQLSGLAFANGCRANLGPTAWSLLLRGACFQHNHRAASRANDADVHDISRDEALTDRAFDASTMVGYVGQPGWTHDYSGKANLFRPYRSRVCACG